MPVIGWQVKLPHLINEYAVDGFFLFFSKLNKLHFHLKTHVLHNLKKKLSYFILDLKSIRSDFYYLIFNLKLNLKLED